MTEQSIKARDHLGKKCQMGTLQMGGGKAKGNFYSPQKKLREGNVFTGICLHHGIGQMVEYVIGKFRWGTPCSSPRHQTWDCTPY